MLTKAPSEARSADLAPAGGRWAAAAWIPCAILFVLLATANGAGYRYGVSDQAFYVPVVVRALDPAAFPRDGSLIDAQGRLMLLDEVLAATTATTGASLETLFFVGYLVSLAVVFAGVVSIGTQVYGTPWAVAALAAAVTLRHRIPKTSANSLEPYFHPRILAFGLGTLAVATVLRRRPWLAVTLVGASSVVHVTTALWFAVLVGVALTLLHVRLRRLAAFGAVGAAVVLLWAATAGPLRASLGTMDQPWLQAVASKDSLFATEWPAWAWTANLGLPALLWWVHQLRQRRGTASREDAALVWGATALVALFLATLPLVGAGLSLVVQFQISRVFWLVDFLATVYVIAAMTERHAAARAGSDANRGGAAASAATQPLPARRVAPLAAAVLIAVAAIRGSYVMLVEHPERPLFGIRAAASPWQDAMHWMSRQPRDAHVLADPGHAWKYGTSVRVAAGRDVLLEEVKDSALAIYSRDVAVRVVERTAAIGDFPSLTADHARALANRYDLDYVVTESELPMPLAYENDQFHIYALR